MTYFISFRSDSVGGSFRDARAFWRDPETAPREILFEELLERTARRDVLFVTHGFNVSEINGVRSATRLEARLAQLLPDAFSTNVRALPREQGPSALMIGVLWPGDFVIPLINYSFESGDAMRCGRALASFIDSELYLARSISHLSHSLGGRLALECVKRQGARAREVCVTASATDADCLSKAYSHAPLNSARVSVLASRKDKALAFAYPAGDFLSDIFGDGDNPFGAALGRAGPRPKFPNSSNVLHRQIKDSENYRHGDYFPSSGAAPAPAAAKSDEVVKFAADIFRGALPTWPADDRP